MPFRRGQLRYFVTVADEGQMTRAARKLHVAQPALSHAIAQLEDELGIELLERHARGVRLTPAGKAFLTKARVALAAATDAEMTAKSLARAARATLEFGYLGSPPGFHSRDLFAAFARARPEAEVSFRELPFPNGSTLSWLEDVDVALVHLAKPDAEICSQPVRIEQRVVIAPETHPLAARSQLEVADVLEETFVGYDPAVQPEWAGFWTLDEQRGGPPVSTVGQAQTAPDLFAVIASRRAITTAPAYQGLTVQSLLRGIVAIPLRDAPPAVISLVWPRDARNPLIAALAELAVNLDECGTPRSSGGGQAVELEALRQDLDLRLGARRNPVQAGRSAQAAPRAAANAGG